MPRRTSSAELTRFLHHLAETGNIALAAERIGRAKSGLLKRRARDPAFASRCDAALALSRANANPSHQRDGRHPANPLKTAGGELRLHTSRQRPPQLRRAQPGHLTPSGVATFLGALAATANVRLSAASVGVAASSVHARRRRDPRFAEAWDAALQVGCDRLEFALIERALEATGAAPGWEDRGTAPDEIVAFPSPAVAPLDIDAALRLLAHHRRQTRRAQARKPRPTMDEMRASITRKVMAIRRHQAELPEP